MNQTTPFSTLIWHPNQKYCACTMYYIVNCQKGVIIGQSWYIVGFIIWAHGSVAGMARKQDGGSNQCLLGDFIAGKFGCQETVV